MDIWAAGVIAVYLFSGGYIAFDLDDEQREAGLSDDEAKAIIREKILTGNTEWETWVDESGASNLIVPFIR